MLTQCVQVQQHQPSFALCRVTRSLHAKAAHRSSALRARAAVQLRWQPGVSQCEIREIEVFNIDLSRPSPVSKLGGGVH